jgi:SagB-type dehydrogenase family enzyme
LAATTRLSWRDGVSAGPRADGSFRVEGPTARLTFRATAGPAAAALRRLEPPGEDEGVLADSVLESGGLGALSRWYFHLQRLACRGLLVRSVVADGRRLATLVPTSPSFRLEPSGLWVAPDRPLQLCRFAYLRREGGMLVLESPRSHARVLFDDPRAVALLGALAGPVTPAELPGRSTTLPGDAAAPLLLLLAVAGMLQEAGPEAEPVALRAWEFHDLLFHARSRKGRTDAPSGATYRPEVALDPAPAFRPVVEAETVELFRPDLDRLEADDPPLARVVEARRSIREYGDRPLSARQLGEFLFRVARAKAVHEVVLDTPRGPIPVEVAPRPYPSGGSLYELEFYLAVQACDGLEPGLYHHDPRHHRLGRRRGRTEDVGLLIRDAAASASIPDGRVQVVVILAARPRRLAWKYASIAYALTLKHVGVAYQNMYLAATAMGLAPCGLGGGDSDLFARAAGVDYEDEASVGEFLLGSRP